MNSIRVVGQRGREAHLPMSQIEEAEVVLPMVMTSKMIVYGGREHRWEVVVVVA